PSPRRRFTFSCTCVAAPVISHSFPPLRLMLPTLKVKRLRGEGAICLQTSAKEISPDFINVKGEVTGDIHVEITDASRQTLCNALKLQPDEDGIGATLQPA
ncbi:pertactin-like passenger domain-containing protein, partial [Escherichia coli]|uniref:pertactin-like passenger domain-containing protein n=1 Tax=Escherichia coli TaxID=562 RepID=UPI0024E26515